jgi:hypothetical protein
MSQQHLSIQEKYKSIIFLYPNTKHMDTTIKMQYHLQP